LRTDGDDAGRVDTAVWSLMLAAHSLTQSQFKCLGFFSAA